MVTARSASKIFGLTITAFAVALVGAKTTRATAGSPQICAPSSSCEVGEFLYDDSYAPITSGATCTITSRYPDSTIYVTGTSGNMTVSSALDGWYSYSFTAPSTQGLYRTQVCCSVSGEDICVDKSFEVKAISASSSSDIASAVWGYSSRTLSGFGNLISDIWGSASRTLTGTQSTNITTINTNVTEVKESIEEQRIVLEKLVNAPIIETTIDSAPDLGEKLGNTKNVASNLYVNTQYVLGKSISLSKNWNTISNDEVLDTLSQISTKGDDVNTDLLWLKKEWNFNETAGALSEVKNLNSTVATLQRSLGAGPRALSFSDAKKLSYYSASLAKIIGDVTDSSAKPTIYGRISQTVELSQAFDKKEDDIDSALAKWKDFDEREKKTKVKLLAGEVISLNSLPGAKKVFESALVSGAQDKDMKNGLFGMKGVLGANREYLARKAGSTVANTWVQLGSMVFKTLITNPSDLVTQEVPLKYYLPQEVREEHIIEADSRVETKYDSERDQYYIEGKFSLSPGESTTVEVKTTDIWEITEGEINSMKTKVEELAKPLEKTAYFAQGVTLASDIKASLDKVEVLQESAITPEQKIRAYREAKIEYTASEEKLAKLQDLVTEAGSAGGLLGFVGGAQAIAVWGLIIIMVAGFVFLALYMRTIRRDETGVEKVQNGGENVGRKRKKLAGFYALLAVSVILSSSASSVGTYLILSGKYEKVEEAAKNQVLSEKTVNDQEEKQEEAKGGQEIVLISPAKGVVNIRKEPSTDSEIVAEVSFQKEAVKMFDEGEWIGVMLDGREGWVERGAVVSAEELVSPTAVVNETPTGWLRVRATPGGEEIGRVLPGEEYLVLDKNEDWVEIDFEGAGWVSSSYVTIN